MQFEKGSKTPLKASKPGGQLPEVDEASFYSLASEFLEAAKVLENTPPVRLGYQSVIYYLLGHGAELYLKSYLCAHGLGVQELKCIGHDLKRLISESEHRGLSGVGSLKALKNISTQYHRKTLEYRELKSKTYPDIRQLMAEVEALNVKTFPNLRWKEDQTNGYPKT